MESTLAQLRVSAMPWLKSICQRLSFLKQQDQVPQALLLTGPEGIGKLKLGSAFAQTLLCQQINNVVQWACGNCKSCEMFASGTHPDFFFIAPENSSGPMTIDQIRRWSAEVATRSHQSGCKVLLMQDAHQLNGYASNAFLKTLEEAPSQVIQILVSAKPHRLLPTIHSRCVSVNCWQEDRDVSECMLSDWLHKQLPHAPTDVIQKSLHLTGRRPLEALKLACEFEVIEVLRNQIIESYLNAYVHEGLAKIAPLKLLYWCCMILTDVIKWPFVENLHIVCNQDKKEGIEALAKSLSKEELHFMLEKALNLKKDLEGFLNLNWPLALQTLFLRSK